MENNKKVYLKSNTNWRVVVDYPELRLNRVWEKRGTVKVIPFEIMEEIIYDPGIENMLKDGILVIEDLEMKKALGLEPEDATEPVNIIVLNDKQKENLFKNKPIGDFKKVIDEMPYAQIKDLAEFAIENEITGSLDKCDYIKEKVGTDIMACINNKRWAEEK